MKFWLAYLVLVMLSCWPAACSRHETAVEPLDPPDTGIALQHRLGAGPDSAPKGCTFDSLGLLNCPDRKPPVP